MLELTNSFLLVWVKTLGFSLALPSIGGILDGKSKLVLSTVLAIGLISPFSCEDISFSQIGFSFLFGFLLGSMVHVFFSALELSGQWISRSIDGNDWSFGSPWSLMGWGMFLNGKGLNLLIYSMAVSLESLSGENALLSMEKGILYIPGIFFSLAFLMSAPFLMLAALIAFCKAILQRSSHFPYDDLWNIARCALYLCALYFSLPWIGIFLENYFQWIFRSIVGL